MSYIGNPPTPQAIRESKEITAVSGSNTISFDGYSVGNIRVFINGRRKKDSEFDASNGTDVIISGLSGGETIIVENILDHKPILLSDDWSYVDSQNNPILYEQNGFVYLSDEVNFPQNYWCKLERGTTVTTPVSPMQWGTLSGDTTNMQFLANSNNEDLIIPRKGVWLFEFNLAIQYNASKDGEFSVGAWITQANVSPQSTIANAYSVSNLPSPSNVETNRANPLTIIHTIKALTIYEVTSLPFHISFYNSSLWDGDYGVDNDTNAYCVLLKPYN